MKHTTPVATVLDTIAKRQGGAGWTVADLGEKHPRARLGTIGSVVSRLAQARGGLLIRGPGGPPYTYTVKAGVTVGRLRAALTRQRVAYHRRSNGTGTVDLDTILAWKRKADLWDRFQADLAKAARA